MLSSNTKQRSKQMKMVKIIMKGSMAPPSMALAGKRAFIWKAYTRTFKFLQCKTVGRPDLTHYIIRGFPTRMVYLYYIYISCLRYTILVRNPRYVTYIHGTKTHGEKTRNIGIHKAYSILRKSGFENKHQNHNFSKLGRHKRQD